MLNNQRQQGLSLRENVRLSEQGAGRADASICMKIEILKLKIK